MWIHFETFHELSHPTYASKYAPGQGLVLALGLMVHAPWSALWVGMAVLSGLITWALWVWLEPPWAIAGGLLAALQLTGSYWTESYWGGTVAAIGGALVVGALARLLRRASPGPALAFGLGLAILANTRPYEGFVLGASSAVILLVHLSLSGRQRRQSSLQLVRSIGLPLASVLLPAFIWMGYYNYRVTGDPLLMPYSLYDRQYASWSQFLWSNHPRPEPKFDHEILRAFWAGFDADTKQFQRQHVLLVHGRDLVHLYHLFLRLPLLLCILISFTRLVRIRRLRVPFLLLLLFYLGLSVEANLRPHYFAPATALVFLIAAAAVQDVSSRFPPGKKRMAAACALFCCVAIFDVPRIMDPSFRFEGADMRGLIAARDLVITFLQKQPGRQLVLVRYGPHHIVHWEWVYNDANIDESRIVWARAMPGKDDELLRYYPDRRVWIFDEDKKTFNLTPVRVNPH